MTSDVATNFEHKITKDKMAHTDSATKIIALQEHEGIEAKSKHIHGLWVYRRLDLEIIESKKLLSKYSSIALQPSLSESMSYDQ